MLQQPRGCKFKNLVAIAIQVADVTVARNNDKFLFAGECLVKLLSCGDRIEFVILAPDDQRGNADLWNALDGVHDKRLNRAGKRKLHKRLELARVLLETF